MTKTIIVTFTDGTTQSIDAMKGIQAIGPQAIGLPANHEIWLRTLQQIAVNGVIADDSNEKHVKYIAPSQVAHVQLKFEDGSTIKVVK
jgi:hypothetical protein